MTPNPAESIAPSLKGSGKRQVSVEELVASLQDAREDIEEIGRLVPQEKVLADGFIAVLKEMEPLKHSIAVATSVLPAGIKGVCEAQVDSSGFLTLTFVDGHREIRNLSENLDLLISVASDFSLRFEYLVAETIDKLQRPPPVTEEPTQVPELPTPQPIEQPAVELPPTVVEETKVTDEPPISLPEPEPEPEPIQEQPKEEASSSPPSPMDENAQIAAVTEETLGYLKDLGNQIFEQSPVSMYFDDWMVNLRQVILSFESNEVIGADDTFTNECAQIFANIEDELAKRLMTEAELEASTKSLTENRNLLGQLDTGYAAEAKEFIVRGKSALDFLINNVNHLEKELAEIEKIKISYLHTLKRRAWDKRRTDVIEKLNGAKKRLALAVQSCAGQVKVCTEGQLDAQTSDLAEKRKTALGFFTKEIDDLKTEIAKLEKLKTVTFNPVKKVALEQKIWETNQKLSAANKRLELAEQTSAAGVWEQARLHDEYEKKKQATVGKMERLEKEIANNEKDNSLQVRQAATEALANAVKARVLRKTAPIQPEEAEDTE